MIEFRDLTLGYDRHPAVHHLTGEVKAGSLTAVIGPNGAGKSTLLKGIMGELTPIGGELRLTRVKRRDIAYLPQLTEIDRSFPITVHDFVAMGLWKRAGLFGGIGRGHRADIERAIHAVGLDGFENRVIGTLSGGQMQRMLFARLLLQDARVILLDEPFNAIDSRTVSDLMHLVKDWHGEGRTVIAVLHDLELVRRDFPEALLIAREIVAWGPTPQCLTEDHLTRARHMVEAFDAHAAACARDAA
jgi:zinc/manganese transport system ATP-binding protein